MTDADYKVLSNLFTVGIKDNAKDRKVVSYLMDLEQRVFTDLKKIDEIKDESDVIEPTQ